jgi:hypothetical protein
MVFLFSTASTSTLKPREPAIQLLVGSLFPEKKQQEIKLATPPTFTTETKKEWSYIFTPLCLHFVWCLTKHMHNLLIYLLSVNLKHV